MGINAAELGSHVGIVGHAIEQRLPPRVREASHRLAGGVSRVSHAIPRLAVVDIIVEQRKFDRIADELERERQTSSVPTVVFDHDNHVPPSFNHQGGIRDVLMAATEEPGHGLHEVATVFTAEPGWKATFNELSQATGQQPSEVYNRFIKPLGSEAEVHEDGTIFIRPATPHSKAA